MTARFYSLFLLATLLLFQSSCGVGKFFAPSSGAIEVKATWPDTSIISKTDAALSKKDIPVKTAGLEVLVSGKDLDKPLVQKQFRSPGETEVRFRFESVPLGPKLVKARAFDINGLLLADGDTEVFVEAGRIAVAPIDMQPLTNALTGSPLPSPSPSPSPTPSVVFESTPPILSSSPPSPATGGGLIIPQGTILNTFSQGFEKDRPLAVAVRSGTLWVTTESGTLLRKNVKGEVLNSTVGPNSQAIAFDSLGNAWIPSADAATNAMYMLDPKGAVQTFKLSEKEAVPLALAIDGQDNRWLPLAGPELAPKKLVLLYQPPPTGIGPFSLIAVQVGNRPSGVAIDLKGRAWVTNFDDNTISIIASEGVVVDTVPAGKNPLGIAYHPNGVMWVASNGDDTVLSLNVSAPHQTPFAVDIGALTKDIEEPQAIAVDHKNGNIWVTLSGSGSLLQLSPSGQVLSLTQVGPLPMGVAVAGNDTVFVATEDEIVQVQAPAP